MGEVILNPAARKARVRRRSREKLEKQAANEADSRETRINAFAWLDYCRRRRRISVRVSEPSGWHHLINSRILLLIAGGNTNR